MVLMLQAVVHRDLKPANIMLGGPKVFTQFHRTLLQVGAGCVAASRQAPRV